MKVYHVHVEYFRFHKQFCGYHGNHEDNVMVKRGEATAYLDNGHSFTAMPSNKLSEGQLAVYKEIIAVMRDLGVLLI